MEFFSHTRGIVFFWGGFLGGSAGKESACNAGDLGLMRCWEDPLEKGKGDPLQYSGPENSMDCIVHGVSKSWIWLSDFHLTMMRMDFLGGSNGKIIYLQCGRPRFDPWVGKIRWRRKWQSTPVPLPGKSHGQRSLVGYSPRGRKESDTTEWLHSFVPAQFLKQSFLFPIEVLCHFFHKTVVHMCANLFFRPSILFH